MVARMPELRAGADTRRLGIVLKFLSLRATGKQFHNIPQHKARPVVVNLTATPPQLRNSAEK